MIDELPTQLGGVEWSEEILPVPLPAPHHVENRDLLPLWFMEARRLTVNTEARV